jgi:hypothetical protein
MRSERLFKYSRWTTVIVFAAVLMITILKIPIPAPLLMVLFALLVASFAYMVFFRCNGCGGSFSTGKGLIAFTWPYTEKCRKCGRPLGGGHGESA